MSRTGALALVLLAPFLGAWDDLTPKNACGPWDTVSGTSATVISGAYTRWSALDPNGSWTNGDSVDGSEPWTSTGTASFDLEDGTTAQTWNSNCGDGVGCIQGSTSAWSEVKSGATSDWAFLGQDGGAFSIHILVRTTAVNPPTLMTMFSTKNSSGASPGILLYYDDRSAREDTLLWRHSPGFESIDSADDALDGGEWRVISVEYPGSGAGDVVIYEDGVSVGSAAASTVTGSPSNAFFHLGALSSGTRFPFDGQFREVVLFKGAGSTGLAASLSTEIHGLYP